MSKFAHGGISRFEIDGSFAKNWMSLSYLLSEIAISREGFLGRQSEA